MLVINNRFGILLAQKRIREKRRVSLSEVAERTGISRTSLQAWENNTVTRFDMPIMDALCAYFECQPGDLFEYISGKEEAEESAFAEKIVSEIIEDISQSYPE